MKIPTELCPSCRQWYSSGATHVCLDQTIADLKNTIASLEKDLAMVDAQRDEWRSLAQIRNTEIAGYSLALSKLRDEMTAALLERDAFRRGIETLRREHLGCEDCWYSCPKSEEGCCDERVTDCICGADKHNEKLDSLLNISRATT